MHIKSFYKDLSSDSDIKDIKVNTAENLKDSVFVCLKGKNIDTHNLINIIEEKKPSLVVFERETETKLNHIIVEDTHLELARLSHIFWYNKIKNLILIGTTGTDGKTTTSIFIHHILKSLLSSYIGTNGIYYLDQKISTKNTTLNILDNYKYFQEFVKNQIQYTCMEVSSHAIKQKRIDFLYFKYKIFTNLSHEHFDEFFDLETYYQVKKQFFTQYNLDSTFFIINIDDSFGERLFQELKEKNKISFGKNKKADFNLIEITFFDKYTTFSFMYEGKLYQNFKINMLYEYNVYNCIPSIIIGLKEFINYEQIEQKILTLNKIEGRNELLKVGDFTCIIDFAHTPNSIEKTLKDLKNYYKYNRIIHIFGSAGNKDKSKRGLMGKISTQYSDYTIFTNEDPYTEDPEEIIRMLTSEIDKNNYEIIYDRKKAIEKALSLASTGDCVIITGKGMEQTMNINNQVIEYSDYSIIQEFIQKKNRL